MAEEVRTLRPTEVDQPDAPPAQFELMVGSKQPRSYRQQPPLVPHSTDKYDIDLKGNECLGCHEWPNSDKKEAPKISDQHYIGRDGIQRDTISGNRYFCKQCHVPQNNAKPLVANRFDQTAPDVKKDKAKTGSSDY